MDAMVLRLESLNQSSFEQYGPWHYRDLPHTQGDGAELGEVMFQSPAVSDLKTGLSKTLSKPRSIQLKGSSAKVVQNVPAETRPTASMEAGTPVDPTSTSSPTLRRGSLSVFGNAAASTSTFSFNQAVCAVKEGFSFPPKPVSVPRDAFKRRRPVSDVDGPNTASLGCKKRRLRRHLITSRLSQPFSLPATHILNRESAVGDKRFLKLAAIMSARRMGGNAALSAHHNRHHHHHHSPSPSTLLRRAAVINRFRLRVINRAAERGDDEVADLAGNAALLQQSGLGLVVGARFPAAPPSALLAGPLPPTVRLPIPCPNVPHPLSKAAAEARSSPPTSPRALEPTDPKSPGPKLPPSPRLRPMRSPEMRITQPPEEEEFDDESVAFPTLEHESRYESSDDPDDVYADFGVIFGSGSADGESSDDEGEHYEDYMDDLDGIPWSAR